VYCVSDCRLEGTGIYAFSTGTIYQGHLHDGMFHGTGTLFFPNGSKYDGEWENGIAVKVSVAHIVANKCCYHDVV